MEKKAQIRKQMKQRRKGLSAVEHENAGQKIKEIFLSLPEYQNCHTIFAYLSHAEEIPTLELVEESLRAGRKVAAPKVMEAGQMEFFEIRSLADCRPGAYGILEPQGNTILTPNPAEHPIMLLPGLAFTSGGGRLGYGGGYYDRYLKRYPEIFKIAMAYDFSLLSELPAEEHDEKVDMILLPGQVIRVRKDITAQSMIVTRKDNKNVVMISEERIKDIL